MSCLHNEEILENLFEQIQEEYPTLNENEQVKLAEKCLMTYVNLNTINI